MSASSNSKRAFLVGLNYKNSPYELHGCLNDVQKVHEMLVKSYAYSSDNILIMTDDTLHKPTRANILEGWRWLLTKSPASDFGKDKYQVITAEDQVNFFFQYSGHGSQVRDRNYEEVDGLDETICPLDFATAGMITDDEIRAKLVNQVPNNGKFLALIDACHSESACDLLWTCRPKSKSSFTLTKVGSYQPTVGSVAMLSGCMDNQTSADLMLNGQGQGALTYAFLEVLNACHYTITYDQLLTQVRAFIKNRRLSQQVPCLSFGRFCQIDAPFEI